MADLSISASNVAWVSGPVLEDQVAASAFSAGALLYRSSSTGKWARAQCDSTADEAGADMLGLALSSSAGVADRVTVALPGAIVSVGTGTAGIIYMVSALIGRFAPAADLVSTNKATIAALGIGSNQLLLARVYNAGAVLA